MERIVKMILEFILDFSNIGNLCSILGFIITILTLCFTVNVKKAINTANKEILFKHLSEEEIKELSTLNRSFLDNFDTLDKQILRTLICSLKTKLDFLKSHAPRAIPTQKAIKQIKYLYKCDFLNREDEQIWKNKYKFIRKLIHNANNDDLYEAYRRITTVIDTTEQIRKSKNIIS